jgi:YidC/Oxa1 family membrane protein insertase
MDQKRLFAAIALSIGILLLFDVYKRMNMPPEAPAPVTQQAQAPVPAVPAPAASGAPVPVVFAKPEASK